MDGLVLRQGTGKEVGLSEVAHTACAWVSTTTGHMQSSFALRIRFLSCLQQLYQSPLKLSLALKLWSRSQILLLRQLIGLVSTMSMTTQLFRVILCFGPACAARKKIGLNQNVLLNQLALWPLQPPTLILHMMRNGLLAQVPAKYASCTMTTNQLSAKTSLSKSYQLEPLLRPPSQHLSPPMTIVKQSVPPFLYRLPFQTLGLECTGLRMQTIQWALFLNHWDGCTRHVTM